MAALPAPAAEQSPRSELVIPRVARAPTLEDFLEMKPGPAVEGKLAKVDDFRQTRPTDGKQSTERTEAYLGYDSENLYVVFIAFDSEPQKLRARMVSRENFVGEHGDMVDDGVSVSLDTFNDQRRGYIFQVNPYGVQWDGLYSDNNGFDVSFDTVWHSRAQITGRGFVVWFAIPFKSLRFSPAREQTWAILLNRDIPRKSEVVFWPIYSSKINGYINQAAPMKGLRDISPGRNMQFIPYGAVRSFRALDERDANAPAFRGKRAEMDGGVDAKFVFKDSLVLDVAVNPDFAQVESDEPQVTANERFEVFFPEKRPFFLENSSFFQTPINLLFTRRIADPQFGLRLTGKMGQWAAGALFADDESPGKSVPRNDPMAGQRAFFSVLRVNRDIFKQSSIGFIFADREFRGDLAGRILSDLPENAQTRSNRVTGIDGRFRLDKSWVATAQTATSMTRYLDGTRSAGPAYEATLNRRGRQFNMSSRFSDRSPGFNTDAGFIPRLDIREFNQNLSYRWRPEGKRFIAWGPNVFGGATWDHSGTRLNWIVSSQLVFDFVAQTQIQVFYAPENERFRPQDFSSLTANRDYHRITRGFSFVTSALRQVDIRGEFRFGQRINIDPPGTLQPELVDRTSGNLALTLRPVHRLRIDNTYLLFRLTDRGNHRSVFNNHIIRSKWNWQFNRELSLRVILQYDALLANQLNTSLETRRNFNADFLVTYLLHPGTALYVGYNSNLQNVDLLPCAMPTTCSTLTVRTNRFINDARGFFVKFSYLFRF
jgi:hypothetical protein